MLDLYKLSKRRLRGDLIEAFKFIKEWKFAKENLYGYQEVFFHTVSMCGIACQDTQWRQKHWGFSRPGLLRCQLLGRQSIRSTLLLGKGEHYWVQWPVLAVMLCFVLFYVLLCFMCCVVAQSLFNNRMSPSCGCIMFPFFLAWKYECNSNLAGQLLNHKGAGWMGLR